MIVPTMMDVMHTTLYVTTSLRTWSRSAASTTRRTRPHRWMSTIETILTREAHRLGVQLDDEDEPRVDDVMRSPEHLRAADAQELLARTLCHCQRFVSIESSDSMVRGSATSRTHTRSSLSQTADTYARRYEQQARRTNDVQSRASRSASVLGFRERRHLDTTTTTTTTTAEKGIC